MPPETPSHDPMTETPYLVTARKYRPQTFSDLVSQEHVSDTLRNAIRHDRLAHAYLFSGPRGVGKTTAARILAKAINCTTPLAQRAEGEPCRTCDSCRSFEEGRNLNIIEIDAASNRKVEDVRLLLDQIRVPPQGARRKVYVVDEVHMLTSEAFNTLLKTLEEPPAYLLFIFATTEPHKVLPTILSRCQRFDFRRISVEDTVGRLNQICREENVSADEGSLLLIARKGDGALRDALSVFDQAIALCGNALTYDQLTEALGVVRVDLFFEVTERIKQRDRAGMLGLVTTLVERGYDFQEFLAGLVEHFRNLLVALTTHSTDLIEADQHTRERYQAACTDFSEADLLRLLMMVDETESRLRNSPQPRLKLEMALLKMTHLERSVDLDALLRRLSEKDPDGPVTPGGAARGSTPAPPPSAKSGRGSPSPLSTKAYPVATSKPAADYDPTRQGERTAPEPRIEGGKADSPGLLGRAAFEQPPSRRATAETGDPRLFAGSDHFAGTGALSPVAVRRIDPHFGQSLQRIRDVWESFITHVSEKRIHVGAMLQHAVPAEIDRGMLQVAVPDDFHYRLLGGQSDYLEQTLSTLLQTNESIPMRFIIRDDVSDERTLVEREELDPFEHLKSLRQENPIIRAIFDEFGGEPVW